WLQQYPEYLLTCAPYQHGHSLTLPGTVPLVPANLLGHPVIDIVIPPGALPILHQEGGSWLLGFLVGRVRLGPLGLPLSCFVRLAPILVQFDQPVQRLG